MWKFILHYNDGSNRTQRYDCEHQARGHATRLNASKPRGSSPATVQTLPNP